MHIAIIVHFFLQKCIVGSLFQLESIAGVCIAHTDKDKETPLRSDSSLNLAGHTGSREASLIPAASHRQHCRPAKGGLQCPGNTCTSQQ